MPERKFEKLLQAILRDDLAAEPSYYISRVQTFEEAGVPTEDRGLVVTMADGSEYRIAILESRRTGADEWGSGGAEALSCAELEVRRRTVHAQMVSMETLPMSMGEAVRIYQESVLPAAKEQRGFRGALMLTDPDTGEGVSISLWESEDDMHASEASGFYHRKLEELDALFISTPVRKHYEVSVQA